MSGVAKPRLIGHTTVYNGRMKQLDLLASKLAVSERTLRRGVMENLLHGERRGERKTTLPLEEERYVAHWWPLLSQLRQLLRTERNVRLAVLIGSTARGDAREDSDLDLLVRLKDSDPHQVIRLRRRLVEALGRKVDLVRMESAEANAPLFLDALDDGRVLVDRDRQWASIKRRRRHIEHQAHAADATLVAETERILDRCDAEAAK